MPDTLVGLAIPSMDNLPADFAWCFAGTVTSLIQHGIPSILLHTKGTYLFHNRNVLVKQAKLAKCSHLMWIDSDMIFPPDAVLRLFSHKVQVVGGVYHTREIPGKIVGEMIGPDGVERAIAPEDLREPAIKPFPVTLLPTGFLMTEMSVYDEVGWPWFESFYFTDASDEDHMFFFGEDVRFMKALGAKNIPVLCDPVVSRSLSHITQISLNVFGQAVQVARVGVQA